MDRERETLTDEDILTVTRTEQTGPIAQDTDEDDVDVDTDTDTDTDDADADLDDPS
jgi:hypothetical protein